MTGGFALEIQIGTHIVPENVLIGAKQHVEQCAHVHTICTVYQHDR